MGLLAFLRFALTALPVPQRKCHAKEKYASLRVSADVRDQNNEGKAAVARLITTAEETCERTCQKCGFESWSVSEGEQTKPIECAWEDGWLKRLCSRCKAQTKKKAEPWYVARNTWEG